MSFTAPHIGFVLASYGLSALVLVGLTILIVWQARATTNRLKELEGRAAKRRKPAKQVEPQ